MFDPSIATGECHLFCFVAEMAHSSTMSNKTAGAEWKQELNDMYNKLLDDISIDFNNQEIIDIQTAVHRMVERVMARVNDRGIFNVGRIQPAGSMADKTALWKYDRATAEYSIEFDYLAVLKNTIEHYCQDEEPTVLYSRVNEHSEFQAQHDCIGFKLVNASEELERVKKCYEHLKVIDLRFMFNERFLIEINRCLASSCDCLSVNFDPPEYGYTIAFRPASSEHTNGCDRCTIDMPTGTLSVNTSMSIGRRQGGPLNCSLLLLWTSKAMSLMPSCKVLLCQTEPITEVPVYVDLLPAVEALKPTPPEDGYEHDYFIVPKRCNVSVFCDGWRKSRVMAEMNALINMSDKHRKCYQILKCHIKIGVLGGVSDYHVKTVALHHSASCLNKTYDVFDCVREMLQELQNAYESGTLKQFKEPKINLLKEDRKISFFTMRSLQLQIETLDSMPDADYLTKFIQSYPKEKLLKIVPAGHHTQTQSEDGPEYTCVVSTFANKSGY